MCELCTTANRITDALGKVDWKKVGITAAALVVSTGAVALTGGAALPAMCGLGTAIAGGAITGAIGGAAFSGTSSLLLGESAGEVVKDTLLGGLTGGLTGGVLGGLGYGAGKLINGAKNLVKGGSSSTTQSGHITKMATRDLSGYGTSTASKPTTSSGTKKPISEMTNEELVQEVATRAEKAVGDEGCVAGTKKHAYAKRLMEKVNESQNRELKQSQIDKIVQEGPKGIKNIKEVNP